MELHSSRTPLMEKSTIKSNWKKIKDNAISKERAEKEDEDRVRVFRVKTV